MKPPSDVILRSRAAAVGDGEGATAGVAEADGGGEALGGGDGATEPHAATSRTIRATDDGRESRVDTGDPQLDAALATMLA